MQEPLFTPSSKYATNFTALKFCCPALSANYEELMTVTFFEDVEINPAIIASLNHLIPLSENKSSLSQLGLDINLFNNYFFNFLGIFI